MVYGPDEWCVRSVERCLGPMRKRMAPSTVEWLASLDLALLGVTRGLRR
jgi:hypothetical protein